MKIDLPYLMPDKDRHGRDRLYVRRFGRKIRMLEQPGTAEFTKAYTEAVLALARPAARSRAAGVRRAAVGSLGWLVAEYFASDEFKALGGGSTRRGVLEDCLRQPVKEGSPDLFRDCPMGFVTPKKIKYLRDQKKDFPGAANNRRKYLSALFGWAIENELMTANPARDVRRLKYVSEGFHTWTLEEVAQFRERFPIGTRARLALELLLFVGMRRGDFVRLGRQHVKAAQIKFTPNKTRLKRAEALEIPILPFLQEIIDATPTGDLTFFITEYGKPFTAAGFGGWFGDRCKEADVPGRAHGLRKAGATIAAENGASVQQLMAMYGWSTPAQAIAYIKKASQKKLAAQNLALLVAGGA